MAVPGRGFEENRSLVMAAAEEAGRDPSRLGIEGQVPSVVGQPERTAELYGRWVDGGATHVSINTLNQGHVGLEAHLDALRAAAEAIGLSPR